MRRVIADHEFSSEFLTLDKIPILISVRRGSDWCPELKIEWLGRATELKVEIAGERSADYWRFLKENYMDQWYPFHMIPIRFANYWNMGNEISFVIPYEDKDQFEDEIMERISSMPGILYLRRAWDLASSRRVDMTREVKSLFRRKVFVVYKTTGLRTQEWISHIPVTVSYAMTSMERLFPGLDVFKSGRTTDYGIMEYVRKKLE